MVDVLKIGDIYLHNRFQFEDGKTGKKLFIIVGTSKKVILVCKTTSQKNAYRLKKKGCAAPEKNYYMFFGEEDFFEKDTWVQFDRVYEFNPRGLFSDLYGGKAEKMGQLTEQNTRALSNCVLKSEDVSVHQLNIIKNSLD